MHDVIPTPLRSDRYLLAVSFACFAVAGLTNATVDALAPTLGATALAVAGVYFVATYARRVSRRTLVSLSLALWIGFLAVAGLHAVGLETVAGAVPGHAETLVHSLTAVTWGTLLIAASTTVFLGFREYGSTVGADAPEEQVLEGESSEYSTR
ncbi:hypothetical protein [Halopiger goleimassiliensis]|uniref:hypothetical protein n=1 Tax=Halopiger goleimassiliensis TaxID=1293048 RepID=UPI00067800C8|nr:hypothetical protein [Halopiger goleimassiliensis]